MGYEIWDRDAAILLEGFETEEQALAYLRDLVAGLNAEDTARTMDRMQLVHVTDGRTSIVVEEGVTLLKRMYPLELAH